MSGYDIKGVLRSLGWLVGDTSFGSLYPALHALLRDELVTVEAMTRLDKPPRKVYSVTEAGRQALEAWAKQTEVTTTSLKDFVMRLNLASYLSETGLVAHLEQRRAQVAANQAALEEAFGASDDEIDLGRQLTLYYGLTLAAAELNWLDDTLDRLSK
jgi:DNA-binding PadR family transcriptional regulator